MAVNLAEFSKRWGQAPRGQRAKETNSAWRVGAAPQKGFQMVLKEECARLKEERQQGRRMVCPQMQKFEHGGKLGEKQGFCSLMLGACRR